MNELERLEGFCKEYKELCLKFNVMIDSHLIVEVGTHVWMPWCAYLQDDISYHNYKNLGWSKDE